MYLVGSCLCLDWTLCFAGKIQELQSLLHCNHNCTNLSEEICLHSQSTCLNTQCVVGISDLHSLASSVLNHLVDQSIARVMALLINLAKVYPLWNKWIEWGGAINHVSLFTRSYWNLIFGRYIWGSLLRAAFSQETVGCFDLIPSLRYAVSGWLVHSPTRWIWRGRSSKGTKRTKTAPNENGMQMEC